MKHTTRIQMPWGLVIGLALTLMVLMTPEQAYALKKNEGMQCRLDEATVKDPDKLLNIVLKEARQGIFGACHNVYTDIKDVGSSSQRRFPPKELSIDRPGSGIYRDYQIKGSRPGPLLEGHETKLYDVEFIYIAVTTIGPTVPVCERYSDTLRLVNTPWGWRFINPTNIGSSIEADVRFWEYLYRERPNATPAVKAAFEKSRNEEIGLLRDFSQRCLLKLN